MYIDIYILCSWSRTTTTWQLLPPRHQSAGTRLFSRDTPADAKVPRLSEERPKLDCKRAISAFLPTTDQSPWLSRTTSSTKSKSSKSMANKHQM